MLFIVFYHLIMWFVKDNPTYDSLRALWIPLHVGVVCFVLISGYFRIKTSLRGFVLLIAISFFYSLPNIIYGILNSQNTYDIVHSFMFISRSEYWFVKTYLGLYLIAPLLNLFLDNSSKKGQLYLVFVLSLLSVYCGNFARDPMYFEGKNVFNFMLIYLIGHILKVYSYRWKSFNWYKLSASFIIINLILVVSFLFTRERWIGGILWRLSFPYNSPILILNAVLLFMIFGCLEFRSLTVNRLAEGCFAIYLIHSSTPLVNLIERPLISTVFQLTEGALSSFILLLFLLSIIIVFSCIIINWCFYPLWKAINCMGEKFQKKVRVYNGDPGGILPFDKDV